MDGSAFESLIYENASGNRVILSDRSVSANWELIGRSGFSAPEVELITQKYINGQTRVIGRIIKPRTVKINMVLTGTSAAKRDSLFFSMVEKLIDAGGGEIGKLWITRSDGSVVYLNCAYSSGLKITEQYRKLHKFTLEFYAEDPYFYSQEIEFSVPAADRQPFTLGNNLYLETWCLDYENISGSAIVNNPYISQADPVFEIPDARYTLTITNNSVGKSCGFRSLDLTDGDDLIIDTRERSRSAIIIRKDGTVETAVGNLSWSNYSLSVPLIPGDNAVIFNTVGVYRDLDIKITQASLSA